MNVEIRETSRFSRWFTRLHDQRARDKILIRIRRLSLGNPGDVRPIGRGLSELRIDHGPGYRIYFAKRDTGVIVLLLGGDKNSQKHDIESALEIARDL